MKDAYLPANFSEIVYLVLNAFCALMYEFNFLQLNLSYFRYSRPLDQVCWILLGFTSLNCVTNEVTSYSINCNLLNFITGHSIPHGFLDGIWHQRRGLTSYVKWVKIVKIVHEGWYIGNPILTGKTLDNLIRDTHHAFFVLIM